MTIRWWASGVHGTRNRAIQVTPLGQIHCAKAPHHSPPGAGYMPSGPGLEERYGASPSTSFAYTTTLLLPQDTYATSRLDGPYSGVAYPVMYHNPLSPYFLPDTLVQVNPPSFPTPTPVLEEYIACTCEHVRSLPDRGTRVASLSHICHIAPQTLRLLPTASAFGDDRLSSTLHDSAAVGPRLLGYMEEVRDCVKPRRTREPG